MTNPLNELPHNARVESNSDRGGLNVHIPPSHLVVSPVWHLGDFRVQFAGVPAGESLHVDTSSGRVFLKVICGRTDGGGHAAFPAVDTVATTELRDPTVTAVDDTVLCIVTETESAPAQITHMDALRMQGPFAEQLGWQTFADKFAGVTDLFDGLEAHMVPGFHLLDDDGDEIAYVHFWTTGKGVDVSTHNHGQDPSDLAPAFAEVHLVLRNGTGGGGMYQCDAPGADQRQRTVIQAGEEHGPFFYYDPDTGVPRRRPNGAVEYPWHGWQGGTDDRPDQAYDLVAAFEISPEYARVT